ncbi:MAG TPA: hypothetical protein VK752_06335 [Bryobacteraceae bacterium]|jgi:hypothetical protein|nr:hypothetical protein [Bryobacteraceae bacterium]
MRTAILSLSAFLIPMARAAEIPKDTHVLLKMVNSISTRTAQEGAQVYMQTASPISDGHNVIVPVGSYVQGTVFLAKRSGKVSGRAQLAIRLEVLTLPGGKTLKFSPHVSSVDDGESTQKVVNDEGKIEQGSNVGKDAERIAILAGSGAGIGGIADRSWTGAGIGAGAGSAVGLATTLLTRGREVELRQGSSLDVVFDRALIVD